MARYQLVLAQRDTKIHGVDLCYVYIPEVDAVIGHPIKWSTVWGDGWEIIEKFHVRLLARPPLGKLVGGDRQCGLGDRDE